mmetsp:Transcript_1708/g.1892  ORF Transcript_1708/g.1892 Transcript_1708/m.1892 type:complete len:265 (-) Transcript_1708:190-984(-)
MIILNAFTPAAVAIAILAASTIRNSVETFLIVCNCNSNGKNTNTNNRIIKGKDSILNQYFSSDHEDFYTDKFIATVPLGKSKSDVVNDLKSMPRNDLLTLFLNCEEPNNLKIVEGEWDGILLNNNGVLTTVSNFLTNQLFGNNRQWNGKEFGYVKGKQIGINRFIPSHIKSRKKSSSHTVMDTAHQFDYSISTSSIDKSSSIRLKYNEYQNSLSLWKTMEDEIRILRLPKKVLRGKSDIILIGLGSMGWSGGFLNASPFCLIKS